MFWYDILFRVHITAKLLGREHSPQIILSKPQPAVLHYKDNPFVGMDVGKERERGEGWELWYEIVTVEKRRSTDQWLTILLSENIFKYINIYLHKNFIYIKIYIKYI